MHALPLTTHIPLFKLGSTTCTYEALETLSNNGHSAQLYLEKHQTGDWGIINPQSRASNRSAIEYGGRIISAFHLPDDSVVWIVTEPTQQGTATTIMLPEEYMSVFLGRAQK